MDELQVLRTRVGEMAAEIERLQSVIDEANAQEPDAVAVQICDECDIAECKYVRNKTLQIIANPSPRITEQRLNRPARVNSTNFMTGVPVRMVVEAAQRYYGYRQENPPEKDGELQQKFLAAIDSAKRQRITEQDAREIILSFYWFMENFKNKNGRNPSVVEWYEAEGRALLDKLNATSPTPSSPGRQS